MTMLERSRPMATMTDLDRRIANQQRQRAAMRARAQRVTGDALVSLMRRVLAKTEICADRRTAPATHVAKEFDTDDRVIPTDWFRPVCASCLRGAKSLQSRIQLVRKWQSEAQVRA